MRTIKINGERINALRSKSGLSQKVLAAKVNVDPGTVSRWERGTIDAIRPEVFGRLRSALNATTDDLCGEGAVPESKVPPKGQMNLNISAACRNALHLVARRYGVTRQEIVEVSPLLFLVAAEQSLRERQRQLTQWSDLADEVAQATPSHLPTKKPVDDTALAYEQRSIVARDLFGTIVTEKTGGPDDTDWDVDKGNPFALFLSKALTSVSESAEPVRWFPGLGPMYRICSEEAADFVGGDGDATNEILSGFVAMHEIPPDIRKASADQRAAWVRAEADKLAADLMVSLDELQFEPPTDPGRDSSDGVDDGAMS